MSDEFNGDVTCNGKVVGQWYLTPRGRLVEATEAAIAKLKAERGPLPNTRETYDAIEKAIESTYEKYKFAIVSVEGVECAERAMIRVETMTATIEVPL